MLIVHWLYFWYSCELNLRGSVNFRKCCSKRATGGTGLHGVSSLVMIGRILESVLTHLLLRMVTLISSGMWVSVLNVYEAKKGNKKMNDIYKTIPLLLFINSLTAFCPDKCICDDDTLETTCIETKLEVTICIHNLYLFSIYFRWCRWL